MMYWYTIELNKPGKTHFCYLEGHLIQCNLVCGTGIHKDCPIKGLKTEGKEK